MRTFKFGWLAALAVGGMLVCGSTVQAAEGEGAGKGKGGDRAAMMQERMNQLAEKLGLSEEQKTKMIEFQKEQFQKMSELRDAPPQERMEKFKKMREESEQKLKESKILTDEQFAKYKELMAQRGPGGPGGPGGRKGKKADQ